MSLGGLAETRGFGRSEERGDSRLSPALHAEAVAADRSRPGAAGHGPEAGDPGRQPLGEPVLYLTFVRSAYLTPGRRDTPAGTK